MPQAPKKLGSYSRKPTDVIGNVALDHVEVRFKNFAGVPTEYNAAGKRNFCVLLDDKSAAELTAAGWKVRYLKPREETDIPQAFLQVQVGYKSKTPPQVTMISGKLRRDLTEATVACLDAADIEYADILIRPYNWEVRGDTGVSAYLQSGYFIRILNEFDRRYQNLPTAPIEVPYVDGDD